MGRPVAYVCRGPTCGKRPERAAIVRALAPVADVKSVKCQKVCEGVVVGADPTGHVEWFRRVRKPKAVRALVDWVGGAPMRGALSKRRLRKRAGRPPRGRAKPVDSRTDQGERPYLRSSASISS